MDAVGSERLRAHKVNREKCEPKIVITQCNAWEVGKCINVKVQSSISLQKEAMFRAAECEDAYIS
jgi:hypothetical protein